MFPDLTVAENIFIGRQPLRAGRRIDTRVMIAGAAEIFDRLGVHARSGQASPAAFRSPSSRSSRSRRRCR